MLHVIGVAISNVMSGDQPGLESADPSLVLGRGGFEVLILLEERPVGFVDVVSLHNKTSDIAQRQWLEDKTKRNARLSRSKASFKRSGTRLESFDPGGQGYVLLFEISRVVGSLIEAGRERSVVVFEAFCPRRGRRERRRAGAE